LTRGEAANAAQLRRDQGQGDEARDLLVLVYELFETPDLKEAKALLDELP
jgi:hypothetical protein